jgi:hypothetical protein
MLASALRELPEEIFAEISKHVHPIFVDNLRRAVGLPCTRPTTITFKLPPAEFLKATTIAEDNYLYEVESRQMFHFHIGGTPPSTDEQRHYSLMEADDLALHMLFGVPEISTIPPASYERTVPRNALTCLIAALTSFYERKCDCSYGESCFDYSASCADKGSTESDSEDYDGGIRGFCRYQVLQNICNAFTAMQFDVLYLHNNAFIRPHSDTYSDICGCVELTDTSIPSICRGMREIWWLVSDILEVPLFRKIRKYIRGRQHIQLARYWMHATNHPGAYGFVPKPSQALICCNREFHKFVIADLLRLHSGEDVLTYYDNSSTYSPEDNGIDRAERHLVYLGRLLITIKNCPECFQDTDYQKTVTEAAAQINR